MPAAAQAHTDPVTVCVEFENIRCQSTDVSTTYSYEKNPIISFIHPKKSYLRYVDHPEQTANIKNQTIVRLGDSTHFLSKPLT